jgi:hypothetical protein
VGILIERLRDILWRVQQIGARSFSGIGLIVCDLPEVLPIVPLLEVGEVPHENDLVSNLVAISSWRSEYHDGFHVISSSWQLTKVAQYFSPPIVSDANIDRSKRIGGRYVAALFGSAIPAVRLSGIASDGFGIAIFQDGKEVLYERRK